MYDSKKSIWRPGKWSDVIGGAENCVGEWPDLAAAKDAVMAHFANYAAVPGDERLSATAARSRQEDRARPESQ